MKKCDWCLGDPLYEAYHDTEWGVPIYDSKLLFEKFCLDAFQAGLSWLTILKKRDAFKIAFDNFDPHIIAYYNEGKVAELLQNAAIVRHQGKIRAAIHNAQCYIEMEKETSFSDYLWAYVDHKPIKNHISHIADIPVNTELSTKISTDLKKRGFKFCGPTMVYAFMQAVGIVDDHLEYCHRF